VLFRSEEAIEEWCARNGSPHGEVLTLDQVWALSVRWYRDRMSPSYRGRTLEEVEAIFCGLGLTAPFWAVRNG